MTIVFTKGKYPFNHKLGYYTKGHIKGYMSFVQVVEMELTYQKQNRHENHVPTPRVTSEVTSYQATC
jgi:5-hydroxyisourate hydrolase-like protein (transthyretin family)